MIAIVDYGAGNLVSVKKSLDRLGRECVITSDPARVAGAAKVVLPGVGHFAATSMLGSTGLQDAISESIAKGTPFLGICVGMQWMFEGSAESLETKGMGLFRGQCERFPPNVKSPHVGWNSVEVNSASRLFQGISNASYFYFTHSFRVPAINATAACCDYGGKFSAAVEEDCLFGVQFHPEKSGEAGLRLLANFCAL